MSGNAEELLEKIFNHMNLLVRETDFYNALRILTGLGMTLTDSDRASFWYRDRKKGQYWTLASSGTDRIVVEQGTGIIGAAIENRETIIINSPYEDERFNPEVDRKTGYVTKSIICMPVCNERGEVIGAYQVINKSEDRKYDEKDVRRLAMAAAYSGKLLENYLLQMISSVDSLTGLKNRRGFEALYAKAHTDGNVPGMIMCDIDFFKKVNDTYGHNAGDAALIHVAGILKNYTGDMGEVIRWGGEEFIIFLKNTAPDTAVNLADLIRERIEQSPCNYEGSVINLTMSFGVALTDKKLSCEENVEILDGKLYKAKTDGRNRVVY